MCLHKIIASTLINMTWDWPGTCLARLALGYATAYTWISW